MKSDAAKAERITEKEMQTIVELHNWERIVGDRHHTLAFIPLDLSRQGYKRLAEYCQSMYLWGKGGL